MIPNWLNGYDEYYPTGKSNKFVLKTFKTIGEGMSKIKVQKGHEKRHALPPLFKLILMVGGILLISINQNRLILMAYMAAILFYICTWPAKDLPDILKPPCIASIFTFILLIPAIIINPSLFANEVVIALKVFLSVLTVTIFNHTTQWNHITGALRKIHIPGLFVFTIDITLKYIVTLGNLILDLLTSLKLRSVGKNNKEYTSIGGIMGVTFIKGSEMNKEMYDAMRCRCFADDYKEL